MTPIIGGPPVDRDPPDLPPDEPKIVNSESVLNDIFDLYPEYRDEIIYEIHELIYLTVRTNKGLPVWEFNNIRYAMMNKMRKHGFPMRLHHTVAFFDLVMFSIPFYTTISTQDTINLWNTNVEYRYRKVRIYDLPSEYAYEMMGLIPFNIDETLALGTLKRTTIRDWDIFTNLITFGGVNNKMIICNWDKIVDFLEAT